MVILTPTTGKLFIRLLVVVSIFLVLNDPARFSKANKLTPQPNVNREYYLHFLLRWWFYNNDQSYSLDKKQRKTWGERNVLWWPRLTWPVWPVVICPVMYDEDGYSHRLATYSAPEFSLWGVSAFQFARSGFRFDRTRNSLVCISCRTCLSRRDIEDSDQPHLWNHSPDCRYRSEARPWVKYQLSQENSPVYPADDITVGPDDRIRFPADTRLAQIEVGQDMGEENDDHVTNDEELTPINERQRCRRRLHPQYDPNHPGDIILPRTRSRVESSLPEPRAQPAATNDVLPGANDETGLSEATGGE
ncbi:uncharacterized protein LOC131940062 [Physella acuta]|uniref:uncharacterized protein LOC131940062 n=1 Tax=Physella acuta TaxID=109671 RepID=UPI0027DD232C|nr:uncharacterized protein LOC131940062 [Physella acuta]